MKTIIIATLIALSVVPTFSSEKSWPGGYVKNVCYPFVTLDVFYSGNFTMMDAIANQNTCKAKK